MNKITKNIKAYFIDLDGTLLDEEKNNTYHWISDKNAIALKEARDNKIIPIISTGRMGDFVIQILKEHKLDYAVTGNGALIIDSKGNEIKKESLSLRQFFKLIEIAKKHRLAIKIDGKLGAYGIRSMIKRKCCKKFGFIPHGNYNFDMHEEHLKVIFFGKLKHRMKKIGKIMEDKVKGVSIVTSAHGWTLEVTNIKATKGLGNKYVAEKLLNLDPKTQTAHIGDTMNDSTTAEHQTLIALDNADKKLKKVAHYIGPSYKNGGVSKVLKGEFNINKKNINNLPKEVIVK